MFETIGIRKSRNFTSDRFYLQEGLLQRPTRCHRGYLKRQGAFPIALNMGPKSLADTIFQALEDMEKPAPPLTCATRSQWMSAMYLRLIDKIADHHCQAYHSHNVTQTLKNSVRNSLMLDTCRISEAVAEEIMACLETTIGTLVDLQGSYSILKR